MMDVTDRHFRYLLRLITKNTVLYTEMVPSMALYYGNKEKFLKYHPKEKPLVLQVGGDNPTFLAHAAELAEEWGYDEINLNCGCPSTRVQEGNFGVVLMHDIKKTALLIRAMKQSTSLPITIKHRLGTNEKNGYDFLRSFVESMLSAGVSRLIVHARIAILTGLSPKENREVPPLQYDFVYRLKEEFGNANIHLNGGVSSYSEILKHLEKMDGVMLGRIAQRNPYFFAWADSLIFQEKKSPKPLRQVLEEYLAYLSCEYENGEDLKRLLKPLFPLAHGQKYSRIFRRLLTFPKDFSFAQLKENLMALSLSWENCEEKGFTAQSLGK